MSSMLASEGMECKGTKSDKAIFLTLSIPPDQIYHKLDEHKNLCPDQLVEVHAKARAHARERRQEATAKIKTKAKAMANTTPNAKALKKMPTRGSARECAPREEEKKVEEVKKDDEKA